MGSGDSWCVGSQILLTENNYRLLQRLVGAGLGDRFWTKQGMLCKPRPPLQGASVRIVVILEGSSEAGWLFDRRVSEIEKLGEW